MEKEKIIPTPPIDKLLKKQHDDKWVAFSVGYKKIVAYAESLEQLRKKIGTTKVIYYKVVPRDFIFVPLS